MDFSTLQTDWYVITQQNLVGDNVIPALGDDVAGYESSTGYGDVQVKDMTPGTIICSIGATPTYTGDVSVDGSTLTFLGDPQYPSWYWSQPEIDFQQKQVSFVDINNSKFWQLNIDNENGVTVWNGFKLGGNDPRGTYYPYAGSGTKEVT